MLDKPNKQRGQVALAMHSAASPDWGTPMILRCFGACILRAASIGKTAIDLDYASSAYWQTRWPSPVDCPGAFLDGSKGKDVLVEADRQTVAPQRGSGFFNPPGFGGGKMVQRCWRLFEEDHRKKRLGSGLWIGFSVEQLGSLQNIGERNPLSWNSDALITTIVPSRRAHYVLHPEQLIRKLLKKQATRKEGSKQWLAETRLITRLRHRSEDVPVDGGAPSHLSYLSILWHRDRQLRCRQMAAARKFLEEQRANKKSLLHKFEVIGKLEMSV